MYQPGIHIALSSVRPSDLANWGVDIPKVSDKETSVCELHRHHDFILPFLWDNTTLLLKNAEINVSDDQRARANQKHFELLNAIKNDGKNHIHTPYHCSGSPFRTDSYHENEWTIRLFHLLKGYIPSNFKIDLTYDSGKDFVVFQKQYSKCEESGYYFFQGSPEIVLFPRDAMDAGASLMLNEVEIIEVKRNDLHHARDSTVKSEAGQLIACLHMFCVALMLHQIMAHSDTLPTSIQSKGLLMSRNNEVLIITLTVSVGDIHNCEEAKVEMVVLKCAGSREELVCSAVGYLCNPSSFRTCLIDLDLYTQLAYTYIHKHHRSLCTHMHTSCILLNQARAGRRPARAWFLEITLVRTSVCVFVCVCVYVCVCVCVCPPPRP